MANESHVGSRSSHTTGGNVVSKRKMAIFRLLYTSASMDTVEYEDLQGVMFATALSHHLTSCWVLRC